ncbi:hypothetical protein cypCar_00042369 [Cyprinus carpio]|nr:hypothetical protein cypCar_00042369 [Cyprinus carpio]
MSEETTQEPPVETVEFCSLHGKPLTFSGTEDQELACGKCRNAKSHKTIASVQQQMRRRTFRVYERIKQSWDETAEYIKKQSQHTETTIKVAFEKLHQFLDNEEAARMTMLRKEEEQKSEIIKNKIEEIRSGMFSFSRIIESIEEQLRRNDYTFLVNYKATIERTKCTMRDQTGPSGMLINVAKHVGNITFEVSKKLQANARYITFDPNTAHPYLLVSDDLTSITYTDEHFQQLPANPERFDGYTSILGSEGFNSGTHCWDIEVGDSTAWAVGVITESAYKHRQTPSKTGLWYVGFCNGKYGKGCSPEILTLLRVTQRIQRIRVQLDWDKGKVTFTDSGRNIDLHVFKHTFTERVFPYVYSHCMKHPMRIIAVKTAVEAHV